MSATPTKAAAMLKLARSGLTPLGLDRVQAAAYIGISPSLFDAMVKDGRMPKGKRTGKVGVVWSRAALEQAFAALPNVDGDIDDDGVSHRPTDVYDRVATI
jgi:predicted DNA-binding transcriptional regulator AlpA